MATFHPLPTDPKLLTKADVMPMLRGDIASVLRDIMRLPPAASPSPLHPSARATA
jgi:hypothetical protein